MKKRLQQGQESGQIRNDLQIDGIMVLLFAIIKGMPNVALILDKVCFREEVKKSFLAFWQVIKILD